MDLQEQVADLLQLSATTGQTMVVTSMTTEVRDARDQLQIMATDCSLPPRGVSAKNKAWRRQSVRLRKS